MLLIYVSCAWLAGILLGSRFNLPWPLALSGLLVLPFWNRFRNHRKGLLKLGLCFAVLFCASAYYPLTLGTGWRLSAYLDKEAVEIRGTVTSEPEVRDKVTHLEFRAAAIKTGGVWQETDGLILIFVPRYPEYQYGDMLLATGTLETPLNSTDFNYRAYLADRNIFSTMVFPQIGVLDKGTGSPVLRWIYSLRQRFSLILSQILPEPQSSLAQGILLGTQGTIPPSLKSGFSLTGTAHLLAISGINLSIIAGLLVSLGLWVFGRRYYVYVWLAIAIVWFYSLLTGFQAPVVRSAIMATLYLLAEFLGRQRSGLTALTFSAAVMVAITPQILWSVSFQLSFMAMVGLILIAPPLQNLSKQFVSSYLGEEGLAVRTANLLADNFMITLGALIAVWPLIAFYFGIVSFIGPLATFLLAPSLPLIILTGSAAMITGLVSIPLAQVAGWCAWLFLTYMIWLVSAFAALPYSSIETGPINARTVWTYYAGAAILFLLRRASKKISISFSEILIRFKSGGEKVLEFTVKIPKKWTITPLLAAALLTSFTAASWPDDDLHVSFLNVGEGDATLVQKGRLKILVDGGPSPQSLTMHMGNRVPFWDRNVDLLILTHPHADHLSGLVEVLKRYRVEQVLYPDLNDDSPLYQEWLSLIRAKGIRQTFAVAGQQIKIGDTIKIEVLNPTSSLSPKSRDDLENSGVVLNLTSGKVKFLFTADIGQQCEADLIGRGANLSSTVLKVSHHGSNTSTSAAFLAAARPQLAVVSVGADNQFNHPAEKVISLLDANLGLGQVYRTDQRGTIEFITDGQRLRVKTDR